MTAPDLCERTWPSDRPTKSEDSYRQHRCGQPAGHAADCACRYCGRPRGGAAALAELAGDRGESDIGTLAVAALLVFVVLCALGVVGEWPA